jgi:hypothetical protein
VINAYQLAVNDFAAAAGVVRRHLRLRPGLPFRSHALKTTPKVE